MERSSNMRKPGLSAAICGRVARGCGKAVHQAGLMLLVTGLLAPHAGAAAEPVLKTDKDKLSYAIGVSTGRNFKKVKADVDLNLMLKGMQDAMAEKQPLMSEKELRMLMNNYYSEMRRNMMIARRDAIVKNRKTGEAFLAANKTKKGVVTLPSGVQYLVEKAGTGKIPAESDMVEVRYRGTLLDGTEFDATEGDSTANLKVAALIPGWREALTRMPTGSKWKIFIPPQLAYGERGVGADIGPNETLVFDVELVAIK